ncbi:DUF1569 domain-containing protein [Fimbriiglobus ruber]|uniref:DUF1569 domain-containing protein n=1 Tax=Fimbriiglobus ruber TaxID=1908690 RepID=A0A225EAU2_9BACT|nr:DUF1569 domain-containing protein [Fimbriiglobus ruber]OWK47156.1 hypothetical protein FRUB_00855 [Fimbriiglobus ruber]
MAGSDTPVRRELKFDTLDAAVRDAEHLLAVGYEKVGNWDLGQVCGHLADWMGFPIDGFPKSPVPVALMMWMLRKTVGPVALRSTITKREMRSGVATIPSTVHPVGHDAVAAIARLKAAAARFQAWDGEIVPSPFFGRMNKDEATKLQLVHCAHHLSYLIPKA